MLSNNDDATDSAQPVVADDEYTDSFLSVMEELIEKNLIPDHDGENNSFLMQFQVKGISYAILSDSRKIVRTRTEKEN